MRAKLITIFFITFIVFVASLIWRVDQVISDEKMTSVETHSRAQMLAFVHSLEVETQNLADLISLGFPEIELGKKDFSSGKPYSKFQMIMKLLPPSARDNSREWQVVAPFFQDKTEVRSWALPYVNLVLKSIKEPEIKPGSSQVYALMDPKRRPFLLLLFQRNGNWYAGLMGSAVFQGMMDQQKGQISSFFVVNAQGQALAHTTPEYVGSLLTEDPLVNEAIKVSGGSGSGTFKDLKGEQVRGFYEQIGNSNLYAVIATPLRELTKGRGQFLFQLGIMGLGFALVGIAFFVFVYKPQEAQTLPVVFPSSPSFGLQSVTAPKGGARSEYIKVASALSHELKTPLTSILGHAQLANHHIVEPKAKEHLTKIENEARAARELIQKLLTFAGEDQVHLEKESLEIPVNKALKNVEGKLFSKGIKLIKNIQMVTPFTMATDLVVKALENILLNSIEAMDRAPKKELTVSLTQEGSQILLSVADTGEGISSNDLEKVFDPFFTTRSGTQHVGLGLSMALGILKECQGEIQIQSEVGKGTTVMVHFAAQERASAGEAALAAVTPVMKSPASPSLGSSSSPGSQRNSNLNPNLNLSPRPGSKARVASEELTQDLMSLTEIDLELEEEPQQELQAAGASPEPLHTTKKIKLRETREGKSLAPPLDPQPKNDELTLDLDSLLVDKSIERILDDQEDDAPLRKKVSGTGGGGGAADRPKMVMKRKVSKLDQFKVPVRKPGGES